MTPRVLAVVACFASAAALLDVNAQPPSRTPPVQTFRTGTDVVLADVSVRDGTGAVTGLRAGDFVLSDNGVRQRIDSVEATAVPIDLTLVVDVSGDPGRSWTKGPSPAETATQLDAEVRRVAQMLRPEDRLRLLAADTSVQQVFPMHPVADAAPFSRVESGGMAALFDSLAAALLQPVEPARRHVVVARTKGVDTISSVGASAVREIAAHADALLHVVAMETAFDNERMLQAFQCQFMGLCWPTRRFWIPFRRQLVGPGPTHALLADGQAIADGAEATGGAFHKASGLSEPTLTGTFKRAFEDFRSSYVLRYTPQGVRRGGWHAIEVRVAGPRSYRVRARRGYLVEEDAPAAAPSLAPVPDVPRTLAELTAAFDRGAYQQVTSGVRRVEDPGRLLRDFQEDGNPWPASPRKEAAFALELAEPAIFASRAATRTAGYEAIERFGRLVRHPIEPDQFERYWHFAALTLLEGSLRPDAAEAAVTRALARFPDEPRFVLSRAIVADQRWGTRSAGSAVDAFGHPTPAHEQTVRSAYDAAIAMPGTAVEARIRLAWFLHRIGRHDEALAQLTHAGERPIGDVFLGYLRQLCLGHVLWELERRDESVQAFRAALAIIPTAQSGRVALMNALLLRGDREAAEALAEAVQTDPGTSVDPWWMYWQGQLRLSQQAMERVREMAR